VKQIPVHTKMCLTTNIQIYQALGCNFLIIAVLVLNYTRHVCFFLYIDERFYDLSTTMVNTEDRNKKTIVLISQRRQ
jgi:hypothetical protein